MRIPESPRDVEVASTQRVEGIADQMNVKAELISIPPNASMQAEQNDRVSSRSSSKNTASRLRPSAPGFLPISQSRAPTVPKGTLPGNKSPAPQARTPTFTKDIVPELKHKSSTCNYDSCHGCTDFCTLYTNLEQLCMSGSIADLSKPGIRLLCLKPGRGNDPVDCVLFCAFLKAPTEFTALSYVWGDSDILYPVTINGRQFPIARNLYSALMNLRSSTSLVVLWVDAICIDQRNIKERNYQVEQMPNIYSFAQEVIAWLGEAENNSDLAMDYIAEHGGRRMPFESRCDNLTAPVEHALNDLWKRPYWTRVWVVQELAAACKSRRRCIFRCGNRLVSYGVLQKFLQVLLNKSLVMGSKSILYPRRMVTLSSKSSRPPILEILWDSALLQSSDPLDRIYGIRGISPQFYRDTMKVDYGLEFHQLCHKFMRFHTKKEKKLEILCYFGPFPSIGSHPSWLCDLRERRSGLSPVTYSCSSNLQAVTNIEGDVLTAKGIQIGVVEDKHGPYHMPRPDDPTQTHSQLGLHLCEIEQVAFDNMTIRYPQEVQQAKESRFINIISGSRQHEPEQASASKPHGSTRELWDRCKEGYVTDAIAYEDHRHFPVLFERLIGRTLFTTTARDTGLGPPNMEPGDLICVLFGCSLCVVLRRDGDHFKFVGPAYLDGAMGGEYVFKPGRINDERTFAIT